MDNLLISFINFIYAAVLAGAPLLLATTGEILSQKAGNINLGVEGMMYTGAITSILAAVYFNSLALATVFGFIGGAMAALIYTVLTVTLKADQNVTGLTLTIFGTGIANSIGSFALINSSQGLAVSEYIKDMCRPIMLPFLSEIPYIGKLFFNFNIYVYLAIFIAVLAGLYLKYTLFGKNLRAVGENPSAADAIGINVNKYKYIHILIGGGLSGLGGAYIALITCGGSWTYNAVGGQGWIAVALVIFASWSPFKAIFGSLIFGALSVLRLYLSKTVIDIPPSIFSMLPFLVTSVVLIISSVKMKKEFQQPLSCGVNYFREER